MDVATGNKVIERNFGGDDVNIRGKIRIEQNDSLFSVYNDETDHLLFSHSERMRNFIIVDNWFIADILGKPKTYIWKLDTLIKQINSLNFAFGLISKRQLFLLDAIRKSAEHDKKFKLNQNNPDLKKVVQDYDTLPDPIKDVVQEYVTIV